MQSAAAVAVAALVVSFVLGFLRAGADIEDEMQAALALALALHDLGRGQPRSDEELVQSLAAVQQGSPLRHLVITLTDGDGRVRATTDKREPRTAAAAGELPFDRPSRALALLTVPLVALHARWHGNAEPETVSWSLPRATGSPWTVTVAGARDSEREEAMTDLVISLALAAAGAAAMLAAMAWNVRRALRPLRDLLGGIARLERHDPDALTRLPAMPIRELQSISTALRRLADALAAAEAERRLLGQKVLTLQEDERQHLAQELHDEFGQRLTALSADAAWLRRRTAADPAVAGVVDGIAGHCGHIQREIRSLMTRLRPLGPAADRDRAPLARLPELLLPLVQAWQRSDPSQARVSMVLQVRGPDGRHRPWPAPDAGAAPGMPRELQLALYRMSQEALTNVARHAGARRATLTVTLELAAAQDASPSSGAVTDVDCKAATAAPRCTDGRAVLHWSVEDDGMGLADAKAALQRGNGLAGIRERAWAHGSELQCTPAQPDARYPGLRLSARFGFDTSPPPSAEATARQGLPGLQGSRGWQPLQDMPEPAPCTAAGARA